MRTRNLPADAASGLAEPSTDNEDEGDVERVFLEGNDYFNLQFGLYHTAIGYYNLAFRHGGWWQTAMGHERRLAASKVTTDAVSARSFVLADGGIADGGGVAARTCPIPGSR